MVKLYYSQEYAQRIIKSYYKDTYTSMFTDALLTYCFEETT